MSPDPRVWPPNLALLRWNGWRGFTVNHGLEHVLEFGATGSGKTSACIKTMALAMLHAGYGILFLSAKATDPDEYAAWAKEAGREKSIVRFGPKHHLGFNLLEYELMRGGGTEERSMNIAGVFSSVGEILSRSSKAGTGDGATWERAGEQLLRHAVNVVLLATGELELDDVVKVILSAPSTTLEAGDEAWRRDSFCYQQLELAEARHPYDRTIGLARQFFLQLWAQFPKDTKYSVLFTFSQMSELFQGDTLHKLFFSKTDFTPEILRDGAVIIVDAPALDGDQGRVINGLTRLAVERMVQGRKIEGRERPIAILWDEFQTSVTRSDSAFAAVARSHRCGLVLATQGVNAVYAAMGRENARALFGNGRTKLFFANDDPDTNEYMAEVIGKWPTKKRTETKTRKETTRSVSEQDEYAVPPREALCLESGGRDFGNQVTGILVRAGAKLTKGQPWMRVTFNQDKLLWNPLKLLTRRVGAIPARRPAPDFRYLR